MSLNAEKTLHQYLSSEKIRALDVWITKYPADERQSAVMEALRLVQEEQGYLQPESMNAVAAYLHMAPISVYEVASFYSMYKTQPVGKHCINVCTNISCMLRGSDQVVKHLENTLGIPMGQTTMDGRFSLQAVECLGACVHAPMMQIDKDYHENLTNEKIDKILEQYDE